MIVSIKSLQKETKELNEHIVELQKQIKHQLFHLARYAPWGLEKKTPQQYEDYIRTLISQDLHAKQHVLIRARKLEKLNQRQAGMLMAQDQQIRAFEKIYEELPYHQLEPVIHWEWPDGWGGRLGQPRLSGQYHCKKCKLAGSLNTFKSYYCGIEPRKIPKHEIITQLSSKPAEASSEEVADFLVDHIYRIWPNRKNSPLPGGFYEWVLRAALLLRKKDMVKKKNEPVADEATEEHEDAEIINHPKLNLMQGGKDNGVNWLKALPVGTIFLAKKRGEHEFVCHQFVLDWKGKRGALLTSNLPSKAEVPVDMLAFSLLHEQIEIQRLGFEDIND